MLRDEDRGHISEAFFQDHFFPNTQRRKKIQIFYTCPDLKQAVVLPPGSCNESLSSWG